LNYTSTWNKTGSYICLQVIQSSTWSCVVAGGACTEGGEKLVHSCLPWPTVDTQRVRASLTYDTSLHCIEDDAAVTVLPSARHGICRGMRPGAKAVGGMRRRHRHRPSLHRMRLLRLTAHHIQRWREAAALLPWRRRQSFGVCSGRSWLVPVIQPVGRIVQPCP
jgi:hypothetical protein